MKLDGKDIEHCDVGDFAQSLRDEVYIYAKLEFPKVTKEMVKFIVDSYEEVLSQLDDEIAKSTKIIGDIFGGF